MNNDQCYHCGEPNAKTKIVFDDRTFCCHGCKTVYEIFSTNDLGYYYQLEQNAGATPDPITGAYDYLDNVDIISKLVSFDEDGVQVVNLTIPHIHCSSCIWVLENLNRLHNSIKNTQVDFLKKKLRVTYATEDYSLKELVTLLARIGYTPNISLKDYEQKSATVDRSLIYKLGVAGFAFGNVMLLSFPEYFEVEEFWLEQYKVVFRWLMLVFSLPVVFYAASGYFVSAYKGLTSKMLNIDVPIALGILALFLRSAVDVVFDFGSGFFDSLTGLVFFLLIGRFFQQKTYGFLSFERDYKSYFPIAVSRLQQDGNEENIQIYEVEKGDKLLIRNQEILPVDCVLLSGGARIDYSFVTGESQPVRKEAGDKLFAGGKQIGGVLKVEVLKSVSQSYLTQLWSNAAFAKNKASDFLTITDGIGRRFTWAVLSIAFVAMAFWLFYDATKAINVFTAVLIIACPCAIALAAPFTLGNLLRIFGKHNFYVKDTNTLERLAQVQTAIFDKTGTLTTASENTIFYEGIELSKEESSLLKNTLRGSNHPLSRSLYELLDAHEIKTLDGFEEQTGKGVLGRHDQHSIRAGSAPFVGTEPDNNSFDTAVYISADELYKGRFVFKNKYRKGVREMFVELSKNHSLAVLSGDNDGEREKLAQLLPLTVPMHFNQRPEHKLAFVEKLQETKKVLMVGDGLNDAGALAQSDVGIAVSENVNVFSPACDAILDAGRLADLAQFLRLSRNGITIIKMSFVLSLCYNLVGLYFAVTGQLRPVIAAILMPLSSISIVAFTTLATNFLGNKLKKQVKT